MSARQNQKLGLTFSWILRFWKLIFNLVLPFFKTYIFFQCQLLTNIFFATTLMTTPTYVNVKSNVYTVCFRRTKGFLWLWERVLVNFNWNLVFCLQLLFFLQSENFNSNHSKIQMASSGVVSKMLPCIWLLPNISYVIDCICFWGSFKDFWTYQFFALF